MEQSTSPPPPAGRKAKSSLKHNSNGRSNTAFNDITGRSNALSRSQQNFSILKKAEKDTAMKPCNKVTTMSRRHSVALEYTSPKLEERTTVCRTPSTNIKKPWESSLGLNETSNSNSNKVLPRASKPCGGSSTTNKMTGKQIQSGLYMNKLSIPPPRLDPRSRRSNPRDCQSHYKTNKDLSLLGIAKYWLEHIKVSEAAKKHAISIEFFRLAAECHAEPHSLLQGKLVAYLHRHSLCSGDTDKLLLSYGIKEEDQRVSYPNQDSDASFSDKESEVIDLSMSLPVQTPMLNEAQPEMGTDNWSQGCGRKTISTSENTKCSTIINPVEAGPVENAGKFVLETVGTHSIHCEANSEALSMESITVPAITRDLEHSSEVPLTDKKMEAIGEESLNLKAIVSDDDTGGKGNDRMVPKEMLSDDVTKCERTRRKTIDPLAPQTKKSNKSLVEGNRASGKQKTPCMAKIVTTHPQNSNVHTNAEEQISAIRNTGSGNAKNSHLRRSLSKQNPSNQNNLNINQRSSKLRDKPDKPKTALMGNFDNCEDQESMATPGSGGER